MKVLLVVNEYSFFAQNRIEIAREWKKRGAEVHLASPIRGVSYPDLEKDGLQYHPYSLIRSGLNPLVDLKSLLHLFWIYRRVKPDLVHHFTIKPVIYGTLAARLSGVPRIVNTITGLGYVFTDSRKPLRRLLNGFVRGLYRFVFNSPRVKVVFLNSTDCEFFRQNRLVSEAQSFLLPGSGVDTQHFAAKDEEPLSRPRILVPCRMLWHKGVGECIEAAIQLKKQDVEFELWLAGDVDPDNPASIPKATLQEWQKQGYCRWLGQVAPREMRTLYQSCSIVCLPSYREGIPRALLEAASCGRAIVTTDAPGCRDVVQNGVNGLLVAPQDVASLVKALKHLILSPEFRKTLGANGRQLVVRQYAMEQVLVGMFQIYEAHV